MSARRDNLNIVYIGRYNKSEVLSGPEKVAKRIFEYHSRKNKTCFIQYFFDGSKAGLIKKLFGFDEEVIDGGSKIYTAGLFRVYSILKKLRPDIIHIITFERFAIIAVLYKFFNKVKIVYNEHGVIAYENEIKDNGYFYSVKDKFCEKRILNSADKIVFVSEQAMNLTEKYYKIRESKCVILANGIDSVFNKHSTKDFSGKIKAVIFYPNNLYESGLKFLTDFYKEYKPEFEFYVITDSDIVLPESFFKTKPMHPKELTAFYNDKHIFLALNSYDTFSISTSEAMSCGLIPVVTGETGISRFIENGVNGFSVKYGEKDSLKKVIDDISDLSCEEKKEMSLFVSKIYDELNWENIYGSYNSLYKEI
jgi:glycosyltransferase involved in cell wall biosynthesis